MVKREPINEICNMNVKELKYFAKENDVHVKGSDGKPKLKCDLIIDTVESMKNKLKKSSNVTKTNTKKMFEPTVKITINPKTKKSIKPTTKQSVEPTTTKSIETIEPTIKQSAKSTRKNLKSITIVSDDLILSNEKFYIDIAIEDISNYLNKCLTKYYKKEFKSLSKNEKKTIKKCYEIYKDFDEVSNYISILASIIIYYYVTLKLKDKNPCIDQFYKIIEISTNDHPKKMVLLINDSKTIEMAQIRHRISKLKNKSVRFNKSTSNKTRKTRKL